MMEILVVVIYVYDFIITGSDTKKIINLKGQLSGTF
jgi:hypothetical protein